MKDKSKIITIVGPTASGKSDLAVELALLFGGEIISADSRQVYKGLDIGSGKITDEEKRGIPHHLLDIASPEHIFTVSDYKSLVKEKIKEITNRNNLPIITGGTGFYIDTVIYDLDLPKVPPNEKLRKELANLELQKLQEKLKELDPDRLDSIDQNNKVRLIRAIEIATALGKIPKIKSNNSPYKNLMMGIEIDQEVLDQKIKKRLLKRLETGMIEEITNLHKNGLSFERLESLGLEYRHIAYYLQNKITYEEMVEQLFIAIRHYSKRQMTWFKRNPDIKWIKDKKEAISLSKQFLSH